MKMLVKQELSKYNFHHDNTFQILKYLDKREQTPENRLDMEYMRSNISEGFTYVVVASWTNSIYSEDNEE